MSEMKQLLVSSLSAMQSEIQTLRTDVNRAKKRKVCKSTYIILFTESFKGRECSQASHKSFPCGMITLYGYMKVLSLESFLLYSIGIDNVHEQLLLPVHEM